MSAQATLPAFPGVFLAVLYVVLCYFMPFFMLFLVGFLGVSCRFSERLRAAEGYRAALCGWLPCAW